MQDSLQAQEVTALLKDPEIYALWLSQWPLDFIVGAISTPDQEPLAQYLLLTTGQLYWLSDQYVMLSKQIICRVPSFRRELALYRRQEVSAGRAMRTLNQARRSGWGYYRFDTV
jgi:hypothetical protein